MRTSHVVLGMALCLSGGCSGQRALSPAGATVLMTVGAVTAVTGILLAAGCGELSDPRGCGDAPTDPDPQAGLPLVGAGASLFVAGALAGPLRSRVRTSPMGPVMPDPFVKPLSQP